ncbi:MAG: LamG domain-containing protein [Ginsengibacter sp.]
MNFKQNIFKSVILLLTIGLGFNSCQKLERPVLKELILDPPPPPLTFFDEKSYWPFDVNTRDTGAYKLETTAKGVTFTPGVTDGQAAQIGSGGYLLISNLNDGLKQPGSLSVAFWMKGVGPVKDGAQGVFAIANNAEFWGNFEMFLENDDNGDEAFLKLHMFNSGAPDGKGEQWNEIKIPDALNKWTHIAVTYDAATSQLTMYANGQPTAINHKVLDGGNYGPLKFANVSGMVLGSYAFQTNPSLTTHGPESWAKSFNGALDQFRIYNTPLSAAEVNNLYTKKL